MLYSLRRSIDKKLYETIGWNTAKRLKKVPQQYDLIKQINPDVIALQEIIPSTELEFKKLLKNKYPHIGSSFELATDLTI